jgi:hypothetical protein
MQVTFPSHHRWQRSVSSDPLEHFSPRTSGKIKTAISKLASEHITHEIKPLDEGFFELFLPLHLAHLDKKDNVIVHDVVKNTLRNTGSNHPYYSLSLFEQGEFIGGTIFSIRTDRISFAYRVFLPSWKHAPLKISPAYIGEYLTAQFAHERNLPFISHGQDRNPYGLNADIGLATFKLSAGCSAFAASKAEVNTIETADIQQDCLILEQPIDGKVIKKAYLVTSRETEHKYLQVTKYPNQLLVKVLYRD